MGCSPGSGKSTQPGRGRRAPRLGRCRSSSSSWRARGPAARWSRGALSSQNPPPMHLVRPGQWAGDRGILPRPRSGSRGDLTLLPGTVRPGSKVRPPLDRPCLLGARHVAGVLFRDSELMALVSALGAPRPLLGRRRPERRGGPDARPARQDAGEVEGPRGGAACGLSPALCALRRAEERSQEDWGRSPLRTLSAPRPPGLRTGAPRPLGLRAVTFLKGSQTRGFRDTSGLPA